MAPPPASAGPATHPSLREVTEDTPPDLLEGTMDLLVILPSKKTLRMTVNRRTPMMDLLIQVTTANKINPGGHIVQVRNERGTELQYKPSTPIGMLDTTTIEIVPKNQVNDYIIVKKQASKINTQPFEHTFRLQVHLPRNQLYVMRVGPKTLLQDILEEVCQEKNLDIAKYEIRHPVNLDEKLALTSRLGDFGLQQLTVVSRNSRINSSVSTADIMALQQTEDGRNKGCLDSAFKYSRSSVGDSSVSSESAHSARGTSPSRSDDSRSISPLPPVLQQQAKPKPPASSVSSSSSGLSSAAPRPAELKPKKRAAPPPPSAEPLPQPAHKPLSHSLSQPPAGVRPAPRKKDPPKEPPALQKQASFPDNSHSRHSSDSSGYHEPSAASLPSEGQRQMSAGRKIGSLTSLSTPGMSSTTNLTSVSSLSSTSLASSNGGSRNKRRAPKPPPPLALQAPPELEEELTPDPPVYPPTQGLVTAEVHPVKGDEDGTLRAGTSPSSSYSSPTLTKSGSASTSSGSSTPSSSSSPPPSPGPPSKASMSPLSSKSKLLTPAQPAPVAPALSKPSSPSPSRPPSGPPTSANPSSSSAPMPQPRTKPRHSNLPTPQPRPKPRSDLKPEVPPPPTASTAAPMRTRLGVKVLPDNVLAGRARLSSHVNPAALHEARPSPPALFKPSPGSLRSLPPNGSGSLGSVQSGLGPGSDSDSDNLEENLDLFEAVRPGRRRKARAPLPALIKVSSDSNVLAGAEEPGPLNRWSNRESLHAGPPDLSSRSNPSPPNTNPTNHINQSVLRPLRQSRPDPPKTEPTLITQPASSSEEESDHHETSDEAASSESEASLADSGLPATTTVTPTPVSLEQDQEELGGHGPSDKSVSSSLRSSLGSDHSESWRELLQSKVDGQKTESVQPPIHDEPKEEIKVKTPPPPPAQHINESPVPSKKPVSKSESFSNKSEFDVVKMKRRTFGGGSRSKKAPYSSSSDDEEGGPRTNSGGSMTDLNGRATERGGVKKANSVLGLGDLGPEVSRNPALLQTFQAELENQFEAWKEEFLSRHLGGNGAKGGAGPQDTPQAEEIPTPVAVAVRDEEPKPRPAAKENIEDFDPATPQIVHSVGARRESAESAKLSSGPVETSARSSISIESSEERQGSLNEDETDMSGTQASSVQRRPKSSGTETPPVYRYSGPPAIQMGTWGERPRGAISVKKDKDYIMGVGQSEPKSAASMGRVHSFDGRASSSSPTPGTNKGRWPGLSPGLRGSPSPDSSVVSSWKLRLEESEKARKEVTPEPEPKSMSATSTLERPNKTSKPAFSISSASSTLDRPVGKKVTPIFQSSTYVESRKAAVPEPSQDPVVLIQEKAEPKPKAHQQTVHSVNISSLEDKKRFFQGVKPAESPTKEQPLPAVNLKTNIATIQRVFEQQQKATGLAKSESFTGSYPSRESSASPAFSTSSSGSEKRPEFIGSLSSSNLMVQRVIGGFRRTPSPSGGQSYSESSDRSTPSPTVPESSGVRIGGNNNIKNVGNRAIIIVGGEAGEPASNGFKQQLRVNGESYQHQPSKVSINGGPSMVILNNESNKGSNYASIKETFSGKPVIVQETVKLGLGKRDSGAQYGALAYQRDAVAQPKQILVKRDSGSQNGVQVQQPLLKRDSGPAKEGLAKRDSGPAKEALAKRDSGPQNQNGVQVHQPVLKRNSGPITAGPPPPPPPMQNDLMSRRPGSLGLGRSVSSSRSSTTTPTSPGTPAGDPPMADIFNVIKNSGGNFGLKKTNSTMLLK